MTFLISDITMGKTAETTSSSLSAKTKQLFSLQAKLFKAVMTLPTVISLKQVKDLMSSQQSTDSSPSPPVTETEKHQLIEAHKLQNQTKNIKVVTRNDLLYNTYNLDFEKNKQNGSKNLAQLKAGSNSKKSNSTRTVTRSPTNQRAKSKAKSRTDTSVYQTTGATRGYHMRAANEPTTPNSTTMHLHIDAIDDIDNLGGNKPFIPSEDLIKTDLVIMNDRFTENGALLSIPIHKTMSRTSDITANMSI
jgi:hypothetical protein